MNTLNINNFFKPYNELLESSYFREQTILDILTNLPNDETDVVIDFTSIEIDKILKVIQQGTTEAQPLYEVKLASDDKFIQPLLAKLDQFKDTLGGSPLFGKNKPTIDEIDSHKKFLWMPYSAWKDWLRMTLDKNWHPPVFWRALAKYFGVTEDNKMSTYEEVYTRIIRFGLLLANKERFIDILEGHLEDRYDELATITGLTWHPQKNGYGTEKTYIEFIEKFLTEHFEYAQSQGDETLVDYFKALSEGVCFEDRARQLEQYVKDHPLPASLSHTDSPSAAVPPTDVTAIADWDTNQPAETAYDKECMMMMTQFKKAFTTDEFYEHLIRKGFFDKVFTKADGTKAKPTQAEYLIWANNAVNMCYLKDTND